MNKILIISLLLISFILIVILFYNNDKFTPGIQKLSLTGNDVKSPNPETFLNEIITAYNNDTGTGVLISQNTFLPQWNITIDGSGSIVKKNFYNTDDMNKIKIAKGETEVLSKKNTFIMTILSNLRQKINDPLGKRKAK